MDRRLQNRYSMLVNSHMRAAQELAAGVASLPSATSAFAATQGAWRFLNNDRVRLPDLVEPLRDVGRLQTETLASPFVMLVHDWSKLSFTSPKEDEVQLTHNADVGYELTTSLLVSPDDGLPLAPVEMHLRIKGRTLSTRTPAPRTAGHLKQVLPTMRASGTWGLSRPILHVIDREADSIDHYRRWDAKRHKFLIRADDRRVRWNDREVLLDEMIPEMHERQMFRHVGQGKHQGSSAELWVADTSVVLYRPAKKSNKGKKYSRPGRPLKLRFVVVQLRDGEDMVLAEWKLLTNAPVEWASADDLAFCYYWRWRIESFFKLMKSHGQQLERWGQTTGPAIARRLLVAAMACVVVWQLQSDDSPAAMELKNVLIRLSGRQMKRDRPHTAPALLAGLWTLLPMLALLDQLELSDIRQLADSLPAFNTG